MASSGPAAGGARAGLGDRTHEEVAGITAGHVLRNSMVASLVLAFLPMIVWGAARSNNHLVWAGMALFMVARVVTLGFALPTFLKPRTAVANAKTDPE